MGKIFTKIDYILPITFLFQDFQDCKNILEQRGKLFVQKVAQSRNTIAKLGHPFIKDGSVSQHHKVKTQYVQI